MEMECRLRLPTTRIACWSVWKTSARRSGWARWPSKGEMERLLKDQRLGVGYRVRAKIFTADKTQALLIPRSALFRAPDNTWQVFTVRKGRARLQTVEVGLMNDEQVEIIQGLAEDEPVVLAPDSSLTDGARVEAARNQESFIFSQKGVFL
jgi:hypothetical protein